MTNFGNYFPISFIKSSSEPSLEIYISDFLNFLWIDIYDFIFFKAASSEILSLFINLSTYTF